MGSKLLKLMKISRRPSHLSVVFRDAIRATSGLNCDEAHLEAAMQWLCLAQDLTRCGGVSGGYFFDSGWAPPYPETTGYIIRTFLQYADFTGESQYRERATKMGDWEVEVQLSSGAVREGFGITDSPIVFNTGQVMLGWTSLYRETGDGRYLEAAMKAADWLISIQDGDGKWSRYTYSNIPHTYHARVAWPLLEVYDLTNDEKYKISGEKHISWVLSQVKKKGWIEQMGFQPGEIPLTHTIAYTLRGLLESSVYLADGIRERIRSVVQEASENLMMKYEFRKSNPYSMPDYLPATFSDRWSPKDRYSCLTGDCQIAIIWLKLYEINGDARFLNSALKILDQVKATQCLESNNPGIRGGIPGSYPIWGKYTSFAYPNWAVKFFADAIMLQETIIRKLTSEKK